MGYWKIGQRITVARANRLVPITVEKPSATSRNTTTTLTADPHLAVDLLDLTTYNVTAQLRVTSAADAAGDFACRWAWTGTMQVMLFGLGPDISLATGGVSTGNFSALASVDITTPSTQGSYGASATTGIVVNFNARVVVTTAGTLTLEWAQVFSDANNTTLSANSVVTATPVAFQ